MRCRDWKRKAALILCPVWMLLLCTACGSPAKRSVQFFSMDTIMKITAYGNVEPALQKARATIETLDAKLNATDASSAVSALKDGVTPDKDCFTLLKTVQKISDCTNGALNVTLYPLSDAWGFYSKDYRVPSSEEIASLLRTCGVWSLEGETLHCTDDAKFDLGCAAKGYAAQCAADVLRENGVSSAVLALGGNVQTIGQKPDGSNWAIAVADPLHPDDTVGTLHVGETAVVTSGSYQRSFTENGKTYHHILDPETGFPADAGLLSVTVLCDDGTTADALSTALFITGLDGVKFLYYNSDLEFSFESVCITNDLTVYLTPKLGDRFEKTNAAYSTPQILR